MRLKKGDTVKIVAGKDKGKMGKILRVLQGEGRVVVEGINVFRKHVRPKRQGEKGQMVAVAKPMSDSNCMILCSGCKKPTRVGYHMGSGRKRRYCRRCGAPLG